MGERPLATLAVSLAVVTFGLVQVQTVLHLLGSGARLRDASREASRLRVERALPGLRAPLELGGVASWPGAMARARVQAGAAELELLERDGTRLASEPRAAPVEHWPGAAELIGSASHPLTVGPLGDEEPRLLHYALVAGPGRSLVVRFASEAPELAAARREARRLLAAQATALGLLLVAACLALLPRALALRRPRRDALDAYEEAMARLESRSVQRQAELRRLGEELRDKAALARVGELAGGIAHEMRNGLGTILGYARIVERAAGSAEVGDAARSIREECDTLSAVIRRFVEFVRDEKLNRDQLDLAKLLSRVVARESRAHQVKRVALDAGALAGTLAGDEDLLERAFENLVRNALEAAGPDGTVRVGGVWGAREVTVSIEDDGPGMGGASPDLSRPFASTKSGGLGLGLPIALKIVRLHEGELTLHDRSPRGLAVRVRLPRASG